MENEIIIPKTLQAAILHYADEDRCLELLMMARWPDGVVVCPYCQGTAIGFVQVAPFVPVQEQGMPQAVLYQDRNVHGG